MATDAFYMKKALEEARQTVADCLGCEAREMLMKRMKYR